MSDALREVLEAYYGWVMDGAPDSNVYNFRRDHGLCLATVLVHGAGRVCCKVQREMDALFVADGLDPSSPFHGNIHGYLREATMRVNYLNDKRLNWVADKLNLGGIPHAVQIHGY